MPRNRPLNVSHLMMTFWSNDEAFNILWTENKMFLDFFTFCPQYTDTQPTTKLFTESDGHRDNKYFG